MGVPENEFSDLDRLVRGRNGASFAIVADVGYQRSGWGLLWGKGKSEKVAAITVWNGDQVIHQEPTAGRRDAERIIATLAKRISTGELGST